MTFSSFVVSISCLQQDSLGDSAWTLLCRLLLPPPAARWVCSNPSATRCLRSLILRRNCSREELRHHPRGAPCRITFLQPPPSSSCKPGKCHNTYLKQKQIIKKAFDFGILFLNYFKYGYGNLFFVFFIVVHLQLSHLFPLCFLILESYLQIRIGPDWCGSIGWALSCNVIGCRLIPSHGTCLGCGFGPQSGHI